MQMSEKSDGGGERGSKKGARKDRKGARQTEGKPRWMTYYKLSSIFSTYKSKKSQKQME